MRQIRPRRSASLASVLLAASLTLAACGSGDSSAGDDDTTGASADTAAAQAVIAPYTGQPSKFPIDTPLAASPAGKKIAYMDCGTPVCALFFTLAEPAAKALGMELTKIDTGLSADSVNTAFSTAVEGGYDGVFVPAIPPSLWKSGLEKLNEADIPVVTTGVTGGDASKIDVMQVSDTAVERAGQILAAQVVAEHGDDTNVVFYTTPEIAFIPVLEKAFIAEVGKLCPNCEARTADIPAAQLGTQAPATVVNDLQGHPDTTTAVFGTAEQAYGLPQALKTAGLDIDTIANFPDPQTLQSIKDGDLSAGLGLDLPVVAWTLMDSLARLTTGEDPAAGAVADEPPMQILTADDLTGDVSHGWTGYPDFADRFMALWGPALS